MFNKLTFPKPRDGANVLRYVLAFSAMVTVVVLFVVISPIKAYAGTLLENDIWLEMDKKPAHMQVDSTKIYKVVDTMPEIVGGLESIYKHIEYPREAVRKGVEGRVFIRFIVDENGNVQDPEILRDIGAGCGQAAIDAIKEVKFTPGRHEGKVVKVQYGLPVTFKIKK